MIVAAHQPCYLPDLSFFYKARNADVFVLTDDFQYASHDRINRAQIKTASGRSWLTVPVRTKGRQRQLIHQVQIDHQQNWRHKHWKSLLVNYQYAPYFELYADFLESLYKKSWRRLLELNLEIIYFLMACLRMTSSVVLSSEWQIHERGVPRVFALIEKSQCDTFLVEQKYANYLSQNKWLEKRVKIQYFKSPTPVYHQQFDDFTDGLSVVDLLFNEGEMSREILMGP